MASSKSPLRRLTTVVWGDWQTNALWQRILKHSIACTIAVIIAILPALRGKSTFLTLMVVVFANPGQRMGVMVELLLLILLGSVLGLAWSLLGLYLSRLALESNPPAAYTIRALFLLVCILVHGYFRSSSPRLFHLVFYLLITSLLTVQLPNASMGAIFTSIYIPILLGTGVALVVNLAIFPELSSSYLGSSTIDTLADTVDTLARAIHWFVTPGGDQTDAKDHFLQLEAALTALTHQSRPGKLGLWKNRIKRLARKIKSDFPNPFHATRSQSSIAGLPHHLTTLAHLTNQKPELREQLSRCKAAQDEVNFEVSISSLPPMAMKPISTQLMTSMVRNVITLIGACENKFVVLGKDDDMDELPTDRDEQDVPGTPTTEVTPSQLSPITRPKRRKKKRHHDRVDSVKPVKELEAGSAELLESILARIKGPVQEFQGSLHDAVVLLMSCLAYCYDVPKLPSGAPAPKGIPLEEIDLRIDLFTNSLALFDTMSAKELKRATIDQTGRVVNFMPRMETFLVSSFILAFRDSAAQVLEMLRHARDLVEKRQRRHDRSRLWMPQYTSIRQWLSTGGEVDAMVLPEKAKKAARTGRDDRAIAPTKSHSSVSSKEQTSKRTTDEELALGQVRKGQKPGESVKSGRHLGRKPKATNTGWLAITRAKSADLLEWAKDSDDIGFAVKLAIAVFIVTWPAFVSSLDPWYTENRGFWAPMQLILLFEVAIGTSLFMFAVRLSGLVFGCTVGFVAIEISRGNRIAVVAILSLGMAFSAYVQIASKYVKAGMISIVSMVVVALAAVDQPSTAYEVFYKRLVAFLIGGFVAMLVEVCIAPVRARDRLVESLSASVRQVQKMQAALSVGIDGSEPPNIRSLTLLARFNHARDKAQGALAAAETFLPFCLTEPRLKGSFKPVAPIYEEIVYVLHQIIDRMDSVVQLRRAYGSSILEELHPQVHAYRRGVAAGCTLILFSVNEALTTWLPLPQFNPSPRLAQLRLINRVRDIVAAKPGGCQPDSIEKPGPRTQLDEETANLITKRKFLSWNASTAGLMEIIEYQEELLELVKLLVGVNAFRSGLLERPNYRQHIRHVDTNQEPLAKVRTARSGTMAAADEQGQGALVSGRDSRGFPALRKAATVSQTAERLQSNGQNNELALCDTESDNGGDGIPQSLRRVGTRLRQDNTVVRKRAFTVGGQRG